ncbi:hypothetical protein P029_02985 [Anaplasma phagocytophilum str. Norway variant2]|uniref:Uncharacterized protein n=2 Tax=Anaplasma phagocytophilum TaxID=948 RepID=A0A168HC89_ANAPH|nr:hypothetical protein [Anaplasma phagocytophilum]ANC34322.1 hypothetical protein P029_02985 [Anaplasma phagocytophilum str. Norway variant2]
MSIGLVLNKDKKGKRVDCVGACDPTVDEASKVNEWREEELKKCGNLLLFSTKMAKYVSRHSRGKLSTETCYALICDPLYNLLMEDNYLPADLDIEEHVTTLKGFCNLDRAGHGFKIEGTLSEIHRVCLNYNVDNALTLLSYNRSMIRKTAAELAVAACSSLTKNFNDEKIIAGLNDDDALRLLYTSWITVVDNYDKHPEDEHSYTTSFITKNSGLYKALQNRNYPIFLQELHTIALKDYLSMFHVVLTTMVGGIGNLKLSYNTLITYLMIFKYAQEEKGEALLDSAEKCFHPLVDYSDELRRIVQEFLKLKATEEEKGTSDDIKKSDIRDFIKSKGKDAIAMVSSLKSLDLQVMGPLQYNTDYGLERLAAVSLILYPGKRFTGEEIIIENGKLRLLNMGFEKIDKDNLYFNKSDILNTSEEGTLSPADLALLEDIQNIFASIQEMVPHLNWDVFIVELKKACGKIHSKSFYQDARDGIDNKLRKNLSEVILFDHEHIPQLAYESILPRVHDIEKFMQNAQAMASAKHFTKLMGNYKTEALSIEELLEISASPNATVFSDDGSYVHQLFEDIENNFKHYSVNLSTAKKGAEDEENSITFLESDTPVSEEDLYQLCNLDEAKRKKIIETFSHRPLKHRLFRKTPYIIASSAVVWTFASLYAAYIIALPAIIAAIASVYALIMYYLILAYGGIDANVNYLMTIRRDGKNSPQLYFQEQETPIPSVANETGEPAAVSPKTEEISSTSLGTINDVAMS